MTHSPEALVPAVIGLAFVAWFVHTEWLRRALERSGAAAQGRVVSGSSKNNPTSWVVFSDGTGKSHKLLVMSSLARGKEVKVLYDPQKPSRAFVREKRWTHCLCLLGAALMLVLAGQWLGWW